MGESDVGTEEGAGEAPGTAQSSVPVLQQEWGQRAGSDRPDHPSPVGLQPMDTRGLLAVMRAPGSADVLSLCQHPLGATTLSGRPQALASGDTWGHVRAESQSQMPGEKPLVRHPSTCTPAQAGHTEDKTDSGDVCEPHTCCFCPPAPKYWNGEGANMDQEMLLLY